MRTVCITCRSCVTRAKACPRKTSSSTCPRCVRTRRTACIASTCTHGAARGAAAAAAAAATVAASTAATYNTTSGTTTSRSAAHTPRCRAAPSSRRRAQGARLRMAPTASSWAALPIGSRRACARAPRATTRATCRRQWTRRARTIGARCWERRRRWARLVRGPCRI
ncbi:hypothetical protein BKA81DRAFT_344298 [Phyllosticta paracitricarpa]